MAAPSLPQLISIPFANSATATTTPASAAPGTKTYPFPSASQIGTTPGAMSLTDGVPPLAMTPLTSGGAPVLGQDANGIWFLISGHIAFLNTGQLYPFNSALATAIGGYPANAVVLSVDQFTLWLNASGAANSNNPDTTAAATSGWVPINNYGWAAITGLTNANVTLSALQAACCVITLAGTLTGNVQIIFPTWLQEWKVINNTTGSFTVTCKTASGTGAIIPQTTGNASPTTLLGDGTNLNAIGATISTGTFTPTFTGFASSPTGVVSWRKTGNVVTLIFNSTDNGTSNATTFALTNLPAALQPVYQQYVPIAGLADNGATLTGASLAVISGGATITFSKDLSGTAWTASGNKGFVDNSSITYSL